MPITTKYLPVKVFTAPSGEPTCAINFENGNVCQFLGTTKFGMVDYCLALGVEINRIDGGFTIVHESCPMKQAKDELK